MIPSREPIIFIGMHRSGTSLLGRLLESLGLFVGARKDSNNEAIFFMRINRWLMSQCGARWDNPDPIKYLWNEETKSIRKESAEYVLKLMNSPFFSHYLGISRYLFRKSLHKDFRWGWKDPRNTFTLPFWTNIFPEARIIFIERHGVDVTQSLRSRSEASVAHRKRIDITNPMSWIFPTFCDSPRSLSLDGGLSLWMSYQQQAKEELNRIPDNRQLKVKYEELLTNPIEVLKEAADFCELDATGSEIEKATRKINPSRAFSYRKHPELVDFAEKNREKLFAYGYEA